MGRLRGILEEYSSGRQSDLCYYPYHHIRLANVCHSPSVKQDQSRRHPDGLRRPPHVGEHSFRATQSVQISLLKEFIGVNVLAEAFNGIGIPNDELSPKQQFRLNLGSWLIVKFWATSMACVKVSICLFLKHLMGTTTRMVVTLYVVAACCVCWACVPFFYTIFFCDPVAYYWDKTIEGGWCVDNDLYIAESIAVGVLSLATDLIILIIPIPSVWSLKIKIKQKIAVTSILGVGAM